MSLKQSFSSRNSKSILLSVGAALIVAGVLYALHLTKAAGFFASVEPSTATVSGNAKLVDDTAAGQKVIAFTAPATEPPTNPPVPPGTGPDLTKQNCIVKPSACGYPDETNTGYKPTGVTLTDMAVNKDGDLIIDKDGTTIDSKRINGCVLVKAKNVTIKRSLLTGCKSYFNVRLSSTSDGQGREVKLDTANFLLEDVEIDGGNNNNNAAIVDDNEKGNFVVRRVNMHNLAEGPHPGYDYTLEDSFIHSMYVCPNECHTDSIQSSGAYKVTIRHNTIRNNPANNGSGGKNAVVRIATEQGPIDTFIVDNNLLEGGNWAVQLRHPPDNITGAIHSVKNVRITNNRIVPTWRFYPYDLYDDQTDDLFSNSILPPLTGNVRDDTLAPLNTKM